MARMIPDTCSAEAPVSERRVFELLKNDTATKSWTVFHSQGLSSAYSGHFGEVDFVAVIPDQGLLCIEVKGGGIRCRDGQWFTTNREGRVSALSRSPFLQAQQSMFKVRDALSKRFGVRSVEAECPLGWTVIFTDTYAPPASTDFIRAELVDSEDLAKNPVARLLGSPSLAQSIARNGPPSRTALDNIRKFLRPDFDQIETLSTTLWDAERRLLAMTDEQYEVLDYVLDNQTALIHGGAGTGKTLLAVELAKRLSARGGSVLLTCFNRELGSWLQKRAASFGPGLVVAGNLHRLLRPIVEASGLPAGPDEFGTAWYEAAALAVADGADRFDTVIVDEGQDFPPGALNAIASEWIAGKSGRPSLCVFADFSRQALYGDPEETRAALRHEIGGISLPLKINCRNTRRITAETELLTGSFEIQPSATAPDGPTVDRIFFAGGHGEQALQQALATLKGEGLTPEEIVILSPRRRENSSIAGVISIAGLRIIDREERKNHTGVAFSTIQSFKGLESKAVVLIDLVPAPDQEADALLYVGMTRARMRLIMIFPETVLPELDRRTRINMSASLSRGNA